MGCELVVFPELTLTTFFPRWWMTDQAEIDSFFEQEMPSNETAPLFNEAKALGLGFSSRLRRARQRGRQGPPLQHLDPRRARRPHRRQVPQDPPAGPCRARAAAPVPASREALLRGRQSRLPGGEGVRRQHGHVHLQRPPLARDLSRHGPAERRDGAAGLQHAAAQRAVARSRRAFAGSTTSSRCRPAPTRTAAWVVGVAKGGAEEGVPSLADSMIVAPSGKVVARAGRRWRRAGRASLRSRRRQEL